MNTKTLVVGQEVYMVSGPHYCCWGTVIKVTPEGVVVRADVQSNITSKGDLLRFDNTGKGLDEGTHEFGPWELNNPTLAEGQTFHDWMEELRRVNKA